MRKKKIVLIGDSMTEGFGTEGTFIRELLQKEFPGLQFELYNYSVGATRAEYGLYRLTHPYVHPRWNKEYVSLVELQPDLVIMESFAYNNASDGPEGLPYYREVINEFISTILEKTSAKLLVSVTIPPNHDKHLETAEVFYHAPKALRKMMAARVESYLQEMVSIANEKGLPLANAYEHVKTLAAEGFSLESIISQEDSIHLNQKGKEIVSKVIIQTIIQQGLL